MKSMNTNIFCFIIILVSTSLFSASTAVDGHIFEPNVFHKLLLTDDTTRTDEFSFTFSRDPACKAGTKSSLQVSFGSEKPGVSLISFKLDIMDISGQGVATVTSMDDSSISTADIGNKFVATFKSLGSIKLQAIGKPELQASTTNITKAFSFDKFSSTHFGITFYAWFTDTNAQRCLLNFDFPDYDVLEGETILPPIAVIPPNTLPSGKATPQPVETTAFDLPEKSTSPSQKTTSPSWPSEKTSISSTVFYIIVGVATFVMMILISAVTSYFVLSRFSYSKPPENVKPKIDAEETKTKATTVQYNIHNYFPNIKTKIHKNKNNNAGEFYGIQGDGGTTNTTMITVNKQNQQIPMALLTKNEKEQNIQKESQSLFPDNLSNGKDPESLKGIPLCINHQNHGSHSTNTLDSKAGEQIKHDVDVPKEVAPLLKNNSLCRITYHFNEIQSPAASNTSNGSNNPDSTLFPIAFIASLLLFKSGNEVTTDKKTIYIHNEKNIFQGLVIGGAVGSGVRRNSNKIKFDSQNNQTSPQSSKYIKESLNDKDVDKA